MAYLIKPKVESQSFERRNISFSKDGIAPSILTEIVTNDEELCHMTFSWHYFIHEIRIFLIRNVFLNV
jgi:hypothetical protein